MVMIRSRLLLFCLLAMATRVTAAQSCSIDWRFFTTADGLGENWINNVTIGINDTVWVYHAGIHKLSWMDGWSDEKGFFANKFPDPGEEDLKVIQNQAGQLWSIYKDGIQQYKNGGWIRHPLEDVKSYYPSIGSRDLIPILSLSPNRVFYLLADRLMLFNAETGIETVVRDVRNSRLGEFTDMAGFARGGIWVTGKKGVAFQQLSKEGELGEWRDHIPELPDISNFKAPVEGAGPQLCMVADRSDRANSQIVLFDGSAWELVAGNFGCVSKCWKDDEDCIWMWIKHYQSTASARENDRIAKLYNGKLHLLANDGILASLFKTATPGSSGVCWLATSHGLARYTPSLWRTPLEVKDEKNWIHSMYQDQKGAIWFAGAYHLLLFDATGWSKYPLPGNLETNAFLSSSICALPDGGLAIGTSTFNDFILTFNPKNKEYNKVFLAENKSAKPQHETNGLVGRIFPSKSEKIWVQALDSLNAPGFHVELFDGTTFERVCTIGSTGKEVVLKYILETGNGDVLLGGEGWFGRLPKRDNGYGDFEFVEYSWGNVFSIFEYGPAQYWVGTSEGLLEFDGHNWTVIKQDLVSVRDMHRDRYGTIWLASQAGIHRYFNGNWIANTEEDGLPSTLSLCVGEDSTGRIWAGTVSGLSVYRRDADTDPPRTFIPTGANSDVFPPDKQVRLQFSGRDRWKHTRAERLLYSYRVDNDPWSDFRQEDAAVLENLKYGTHSIQVRAMDVNTNVDPRPAQFGFEVIPPWYRELTFVFLAALAVTLIILLVIQLIKRYAVLEQLVAKRTKDFKNANASLTRERKALELMLSDNNFLVEIASTINTTSSTREEMIKCLDLLSRKMQIDSIVIVEIGNQTEKLLPPSFIITNRGVQDVTEEYGSFPSVVLERLETQECFICPDTRNLGNCRDNFFCSHGIYSVCIFPELKIMRGVTALFCYSKPEQVKWKDQEIELLEAVNAMLVNAWYGYREFHKRLAAEKMHTEAVKVAEKSVRMASIGTIAAGITHEINQPLNSLRIITENALWDFERKIATPRTEYLSMFKQMFAQINRIDDIIIHMRELWDLPVQKEQTLFNINDAVHSSLSLIDTQIRAHGIELEVMLRRKPLHIMGNRIHLEQISVNLIVNAMQALDQMGAGEKVIRIKTRRKWNWGILEVEDNGCGIPEMNRDMIFEPTYSTRKPGEGMGLGLAIVKRFVEEMNGTIKVGGSKEQGAKFSIIFPLS